MDAESAGELLDLAESRSQDLAGADAKESLEQLEARSDELMTAIAWFLDNGCPDEALRLANALYRFWITSRRFDEGAHWFDRVLESEGGAEGLRGRAYLSAGFMPFWLGDDDRAAFLFGRALDAGRELEDPALTSQALGGLARVELRADVAEGRRLAREAFEVSDAAGDDPGRSNALHLLGVGAQIAGDLLEARDWMTQRLALVRAMGNDFLVASEASNLSMVERQIGNLETAEDLAHEAIRICETIGDRFTTPFAMAGLAAIALERGDHARSAKLVGAVEGLMEATQMAWPPDERPHYERILAELPKAMGRGEFERMRKVGLLMPPAEAVALALNATG
jgi:tetratricopeptide (TPR) repeat protein